MQNRQLLGTIAIEGTANRSGYLSSFPTKWLPEPLKDILTDKEESRRRREVLDDGGLVSQTLSGDLKSYEVLVRRYQKLVYNVIYQMVLNHETAADLTQETFLKAFKALGSFRTDLRFKPWLLRIATNSALNSIRDKKEQASLEAMLEDNPALEPADRQNVEEEVEWRLSHAMLSDALRELSARHRQFFILRYQQDLSLEDISTITGEPETTIKPLLFRIRERLRKLLEAKMRDQISEGGD